MKQVSEIDAILDRAEEALAGGESLEGTGFWKAVGKLRKDPKSAAAHAARVGRIDREAFERGVRLRVPVWLGNLLLAGGTLAGAVGVALTPRFDGLAKSLVYLGAFGALDVCTHSLAHFVTGKAMGMRFTHYFIGGPPPPRPGAKVDYETYLRVPPAKRAIMHASGAVITKVVPFVVLPVGLAAGVAGWALVAVGVVGIGQIVTDVLFSTKTSDWKKVKRELAAARSSKP
jgi:hypothetical protein